jgi:hypothetical protein
MLTTAAQFTEPWEAHLFRMLLEAEGLFAVVAFDNHPWATYAMSWAIGGVRVLVVEEELEQARAIEERCIAGEYKALVDTEFGFRATAEPAMPPWYRPDIIAACALSLVATVVFGVPIPIRPRRRRSRQYKDR